MKDFLAVFSTFLHVCSVHQRANKSVENKKIVIRTLAQETSQR